MFKEEREQSQFTWNMLGDIEAGRPNLGPMMHLAVYRLMQFTLRDILIRDFGVETADRIFYEAGKKAGEEFCRNLLPDEKDMNSFCAGVQQQTWVSAFFALNQQITTRVPLSSPLPKIWTAPVCRSVMKRSASMTKALLPACSWPIPARILKWKKWTAGAPATGSAGLPRSRNKEDQPCSRWPRNSLNR
jgi:hypothetical protein